VAAASVAATAGVMAFTMGGRTEAAQAPGPQAPETVQVVKTDLSDSRDFAAAIGFGPAQTLTGRSQGTITWLPAPGRVVGRGQPLYRVDNRPVSLFLGATPLWRKLDGPGIKGPDVRIVKDNLAALGYLSGSKNDELTPAAVRAVKRWQRSIEVAETGVIDVGDVVILPDKVRIDTIMAQLAGPANGELMSITATRRAVTAPVDAADVGVFTVGAKVTVVLPDGKEAAGKVSAISNKAEGGGTSGLNGQDSQNGQQDQATVAVGITLANPGVIGNLESGPARVRIAADTRRGVLAVPVTTLLALREGGYGVQVRRGAQSTLVAVKTGMFSGGMVEISGGGIQAGVPVVTTS
jgi:peptidoglycan hydrolase-like protein with peptidoglycan-binding domain